MIKMIYLDMKKKNKYLERKKVLEEEMRKNLLRRKIQKDKKKMIERKIK